MENLIYVEGNIGEDDINVLLKESDMSIVDMSWSTPNFDMLRNLGFNVKIYTLDDFIKEEDYIEGEHDGSCDMEFLKESIKFHKDFI